MGIDWGTVLVSLLATFGTIIAAFIVYKGSDRASARTAAIQERVADGDHDVEVSRLYLERLGRVEAELQTERGQRVVDREILQSIRADLRDERRITSLSVDYIMALVQAINDSDCEITVPSVPLELRRRLTP